MLLDLGQQPSGAAQDIGIAGDALQAAVLLLGHQPGTRQHGHVLLHRGKRHVVAGRQLAHGGIGVHDALENVAARAIRQRPEHMVQMGGRRLFIYNHSVVDSSTCVRGSSDGHDLSESTTSPGVPFPRRPWTYSHHR